jgi:CheY-like chemotaxis protein
MTILVVDDEGDQRLLMKSLLAMEGWDIVLAENGEEALAKIAREKVDLIVSDIYMPVMDGIKLHKTIRVLAGYEMIPFLFISAYDDQYTMEAVKNPKVDGFFRKGNPLRELKDWVRFLTAPEDQRPKFPPGQKQKPGSFNSTRDRSPDSER